jgi:hypothetical protein
MRPISGTITLTLACSAALAVPTSANAHDDPAAHGSAGTKLTKTEKKQIARARAATERYSDVGLAVAKGYKPASPCVSADGLGGMGFHYVKSALMASPQVDLRKPEALLIAPGKGGKPTLIGVEYMAIDADGDVATDDDRPRLFGQDFDGPIPARFPGDAVHYELHVWLHKKNPSGLFAPFNPNVRC